jgi:hypothetical protein
MNLALDALRASPNARKGFADAADAVDADIAIVIVDATVAMSVVRRPRVRLVSSTSSKPTVFTSK